MCGTKEILKKAAELGRLAGREASEDDVHHDLTDITPHPSNFIFLAKDLDIECLTKKIVEVYTIAYVSEVHRHYGI
jgi:hypothetical protein